MKLKFPFAVILAGIWLGFQSLRFFIGLKDPHPILLVGLPIMFILIGISLFRFHNWARIVVIFLMILWVIASMDWLGAIAGQIRMQTFPHKENKEIIWFVLNVPIFGMVIPILAIFLLTRPKVKELFCTKKITDESTAKP